MRGFLVGVVGVGGMGLAHLRALAELPAFSVVAVCDHDAERLRSLPVDLVPGARRYSCSAAMFDDRALDLVVLATPPDCRSGPTLVALSRGVAVLCEKPFAMDLLAADRMVQAAEKSQTPLAVHHQLRVGAALLRARELLRDGLIGDVLALRGRGKGGRRGGVELLEIGIHLADLMAWLFGPADWCAAHIWEDGRLARAGDIRTTRQVAPHEPELGLVLGTQVVASYGFPGGVLGELRFDGAADRVPRNYGLDVFGSRGQLSLRLSRFVNQPLWHLPHRVGAGPGRLGEWRAVTGLRGANQGLVLEHYRALVHVLNGDRRPPCGAKDGRQALELVLAAFRSHRAGGCRVEIPAPSRHHPLEGWAEPAASGCRRPRGTV